MRRVGGNGGFPDASLKIEYRDSFHCLYTQVIEFWTSKILDFWKSGPKRSVQVFSQEVNRDF